MVDQQVLALWRICGPGRFAKLRASCSCSPCRSIHRRFIVRV